MWRFTTSFSRNVVHGRYTVYVVLYSYLLYTLASMNVRCQLHWTKAVALLSNLRCWWRDIFDKQTPFPDRTGTQPNSHHFQRLLFIRQHLHGQTLFFLSPQKRHTLSPVRPFVYTHQIKFNTDAHSESNSCCIQQLKWILYSGKFWKVWSEYSLFFYVGPDRFVVCDVFLSVLWWIYCYNIAWTRAHLSV